MARVTALIVLSFCGKNARYFGPSLSSVVSVNHRTAAYSDTGAGSVVHMYINVHCYIVVVAIYIAVDV
jgi:hypothetical protein